MVMRVVSVAVVIVAVVVGWSSRPVAGQSADRRAVSAIGQAPAGAVPTARSVVDTYCAGCHNGVMRSPSGAVLDRFDTAPIGADPDAWSRAYRQAQAGTMPPAGAARPDRAGYGALLMSIESALGADVPAPEDSSSQEIAGRLATLLWNGAPDEALLEEVRREQLTQPAVLEAQVRRMLADDRAEAFVSRFFFPWLGLDQLGTADPDTTHFPDYDVSLRDAMARETALFVGSQLRDDRDPIELWNASYTFLNERLAGHYGVPGVTGSQFRRVPLSTAERAGLLGQGSILMVTSRHQHGADAAYTSPAMRAMWVRMHFLGAPVPRAFPGAQPVKPELPITPQTRTLPAEPCVNCHRNFFPLGYALEQFDPIGRWRTRDQAGPVDVSGTLVDGTPTNGVVELRAALLQYPDAFRTTITERLLLYASGMPVTGARPTPGTLVRARQILRGATPARWSSIVAGVVRSQPPAGR